MSVTTVGVWFMVFFVATFQSTVTLGEAIGLAITGAILLVAVIRWSHQNYQDRRSFDVEIDDPYERGPELSTEIVVTLRAKGVIGPIRQIRVSLDAADTAHIRSIWDKGREDLEAAMRQRHVLPHYFTTVYPIDGEHEVQFGPPRLLAEGEEITLRIGVESPEPQQIRFLVTAPSGRGRRRVFRTPYVRVPAVPRAEDGQ